MDREHYDAFAATVLRYGGKWTCVHCPVQAEGRLEDGRPWYFRARHGAWSLQVGERGDEDAVEGRWVAEGDDPWDGFMPAHEAAARIHQALDWHANLPHVAALGCKGVGEPHYDVTTKAERIDGRWWVTYWHRGEKLRMASEGDLVVARCTAIEASVAAEEVRGGR